MEDFLQDLRFSARSLRRRPAFFLIALATLALGFGANLAMVSLAEAIFLHPLPYKDAERLTVLWRQTEHLERSGLSFPTLFDWRERQRSFSDFSFLIGDHRNLTGDEGEAQRLDTLLVSADLLTTFGVEPLRGRSFTADDDAVGAERTAILSHELWQRRFGGDTAILGQTIALDQLPYTVIGVLPPGLASERLGRTPLGDVWLPAGLFFDELPVDDRATRIGIVPVGRLARGVDLAAARRDMERVAAELEAEYPLTHRGNRARLAPALEDLVGDLRPALLLLLATVSFVLLIACANLVGLLLTRFLARQNELAMRSALGASRERLVRQGLTEAFFLAALGSGIGLLLARFALPLIPVFLPDHPRAATAGIGPWVAIAAVCLAFAVTLLIGLLPSLRVASPSWSRLGLSRGASASLPHQRLRQALVVFELAVALVLVIGASLALRSFQNLRGEKPGFTAENVLCLLVSPATPKYVEAEDWVRFFDRTLEKIAPLPGVESAAVSSWVPLGAGGGASRVLAGDRPIPSVPDMSVTDYLSVSSGYFETLGIELLEGRTFHSQDDDRLGAPQVAVISESLARHFWPDRSPLGQRIAFELDGTPQSFEPRWREVVGVVADVRYRDLRAAPENTIYVPYRARPLWDEGYAPMMAMMLKTATEPEALASVVRAAMRKIDPAQPVYGVRTMREIVDDQLGHPRMVSALLAVFAVLALVLALVGIYGVVSYMVAARTREIGVRIALGARPVQVLRRLLKHNLGLIALGVTAGLGLALALTRLMSSELYGVEALEPGIFAATAAALTGIAFLATLIPALRAMRVDAARSLSCDGSTSSICG